MHRAERIVVYILIGTALLIGLHRAPWESTSHAQAQPAKADQSPRIATCDVFSLVERVLLTETFFTPRKQNEESMKSTLMPLQSSLQQLQGELQGADPNKPENQAKAREYTNKRAEYMDLGKQLQEQHIRLVATQFADAYERVREGINKIAKDRGYTHVISQRAGRMAAVTDAQKVAEEFLARPLAMAPDDGDITDAVGDSMNLPERTSPEPVSRPGTDKK